MFVRALSVSMICCAVATKPGCSGSTEPDAGSPQDAMIQDAVADGIGPDATNADASQDSGGLVADGGEDGSSESAVREASSGDGAPDDIDATLETGEVGGDDAAGIRDAALCQLATLPSTPFAPLSGNASLSGTMSVPTAPANLGCEFLVASNTTGTLTFSFTDSSMPSPSGTTGCTFTYVDASGGAFTSTLPTSTFDGDTYQCTYAQSGFVNGIYGPCPELSQHQNGIAAAVTLTVRRSTGAVSLARSCSYQDGTCGLSTYVPNSNGTQTSQFNLSGVLSCGDGG